MGQEARGTAFSIEALRYKVPQVEMQSIMGVLSVFLSSKSLGGIECVGFKLDKLSVTKVGQAHLRIYSSLGSSVPFFAVGQFYLCVTLSSEPFFF